MDLGVRAMMASLPHGAGVAEEHDRDPRFTVRPTEVLRGGERVCHGSSLLVWPAGAFHRVISDAVLGSASINLAVHHEGFDLRYEFDIYDVDVDTGTYRVIREGHEDQG